MGGTFRRAACGSDQRLEEHERAPAPATPGRLQCRQVLASVATEAKGKET